MSEARMTSTYGEGFYVLADAAGRIYCRQGQETWWQLPPKVGTGWGVPFPTEEEADAACIDIGGWPEWVDGAAEKVVR